MELLIQISKNLQDGNDGIVAQLVQQAIEQSVLTKQILDDGLIAGMNMIGKSFKAHEIFLPDVLMAAKAMNIGLDKLKPLLIRDNIPAIGKIIIGSVQGDLHDIGKNLVGIMLKGVGFEVIDLGNDVAPECFVQGAIEHNATIIGMSALLTTTMPIMKKVVEILENRQLCGQIKTIVGGAPVSHVFAKDIGADSYGFDAANAVEQVQDLIS